MTPTYLQLFLYISYDETTKNYSYIFVIIKSSYQFLGVIPISIVSDDKFARCNLKVTVFIIINIYKYFIQNL